LGGRSRVTGALRHALPAFVAVAYAALAFADGGYSQELIAGATIGIWLVLGIVVVARAWPRALLPVPAVVTGTCLAGLGGLSALSMLWADDAGRAFFAVVRVAGYLGLFALVVAGSPPGGARAWLVGLAAGLTIVCAAALSTRFDPSLFGGGDRHLSELLPSSAGRLSYPIGYWNGLAACLAIDAVLLAWLGAHARERLGRAVAVGLLPLPVLALYLTSSRAGFGAALVGGAVLLALERTRVTLLGGMLLGGAGGTLLVLLASTRDDFLRGLATSTAYSQGLEMLLAALACVLAVGASRYRLDRSLARMRLPAIRWRFVVPVLVVAGAIALVAARLPGRVHEFSSIYGAGSATPGQRDLVSASGSGRYQFWGAALHAFGSNPIKGIGAGNYQLYWNAHPEAPLWILNAHSLYLETLAELGILGLPLVLGFLGTAAVSGLRRIGHGLRAEVAAALAVLAAGALSAGLEWTWQLPAAFVPVVIAVALLTGPATRGDVSTGEEPTARRGSARRLGLAIATIVLGWVSVWAGGVALATDWKLDSSRTAAEQGDLTAAADDARDAAGIQPWSVEPRLQLALVEERAGNLRAARTAVMEAIDRAAGDWRPWAVWARIDARLGDLATSRGDAEIANALRPVPLPAEFLRVGRG